MTAEEKPRTWRASVAYDGTEFAGFQVQTKQPVRTVQGELETALYRLTGERVRVTGASRTDAGVHAIGQVISFRSGSSIPEARWAPALNSVLPEDVRVLRVSEAPEGFHPRFDAVRKVYRYAIVDGRAAGSAVLWRRYVWQVAEALDVEAMRAVAGAIAGKHDFSSFRAAGSAVKNPVRTVTEARWETTPLQDADPVSGWERGPGPNAAAADGLAKSGTVESGYAESGRLLVFVIAADGFLYNMVRNLVGTMVQVGRGKRPADDFERLLAARDRRLAGATAPAHGLCLIRVEF